MKKIVSKGRLLLRKILVGLSAGAVALTFSACYGMEPRPDALFQGTVNSDEGPIPGILVSTSCDFDHAITDSEGKYQVYVYEGTTFSIAFKDIDGPENGEYQDKEVSWDINRGSLNVTLQPLSPEEEPETDESEG